MTEIALSRPAMTKTDNTDLIAKRYRTERRFRMYGLAALAVTGAFLLFLVLDVVSRAIPAFTEHTVSLPVELAAADFDAANPAAGDYTGLAKGAVRTLFPTVSSRADRKALTSLLSSGAGDDLRNAVVSDPALIGTKFDADFLLSDDADLYLKGLITGVSREAGKAPITVSKSGETYQLYGAEIPVGTVVRVFDGVIKLAASPTSMAPS